MCYINHDLSPQYKCKECNSGLSFSFQLYSTLPILLDENVNTIFLERWKSRRKLSGLMPSTDDTPSVVILISVKLINVMACLLNMFLDSFYFPNVFKFNISF